MSGQTASIQLGLGDDPPHVPREVDEQRVRLRPQEDILAAVAERAHAQVEDEGPEPKDLAGI